MNVMVSWLCVISIFIVCANCLKFIFIALFDKPFSERVIQQRRTVVNTTSHQDYKIQRASGESYYNSSRTASPYQETTQNTYRASSVSDKTSGTYNSASLAYASQAAPKTYEEYRKTHKISR